MSIPTGGDSPSRYKPNPTDDRAVDGSPVYLAIATAIEEVEAIGLVEVDPQTRKALKSAEGALRRAAFSLVVHHREGVSQ